MQFEHLYCPPPPCMVGPDLIIVCLTLISSSPNVILAQNVFILTPHTCDSSQGCFLHVQGLTGGLNSPVLTLVSSASIRGILEGCEARH